MSTLFLSTPFALADELYLTSGRALKGLVVEEHVDRLVVSTVDGERVIPRRDIEEVFFDDPERNYLYLGSEALAAGDVPSAITLLRRALQLNPRFDEAQDALQRAEDRRRKLVAGWTVADPERALWGTWGLRLAPTETSPVVTAVDPRRAAAGGVQADDQLVAIWGESTAFRPVAEVAERLLGPPQTPVKVTLQRQVTIAASSGRRSAWPGFSLTMTPAGLAVRDVGALGAAAGVRPGDLIVQLDGRPTRYLPEAAVWTAVRQARPRGVRLHLHRHLIITRP